MSNWVGEYFYICRKAVLGLNMDHIE